MIDKVNFVDPYRAVGIYFILGLSYILSEESLATQDCFPIYLVNAESMESCFVCSGTGFISEQLCMKTFVVVADAEE